MQAFRPRRADLAVSALLLVAGAAEILSAGYERAALGLATYVVAAAVLAFARAAPLALPPVLAAIYAATPLLGFDVSQPAAWILLFAVAFFLAGLYPRRSRWPAGLASVLAGLAGTVATLAWLTDFDPSLLFGLAISLGPWGLGLALRSALERERQAAAEAERARVAVALARERAVASERERVTAELDDVLAHALGAMVVQASVARDLVGRDGREAVRVLERIAEAGRDALAETGRLLRLLRDERAEHRPQAETNVVRDGRPARASQTRPVRLADAVLPLGFALLATVELVAQGEGRLWPALAAAWLAAAVLTARRAAPLAMPVAVTAILFGATLLGAETFDAVTPVFLGALAYFTAGRYVARPALGLAALVPAAALLALEVAVRGQLSADVLFLGPFVLGTWAVGTALRATLRRTAALAAAAERARLEGEAEAERAVAAERRRIARELHDLLARSLSVMVVQASVAAELDAADPEGAARAVTEVERSGRAALGETGRLLRLLGEGAGAEGNGTRPQPGAADLPALAAEYARAGLAVEVEVEADTLDRMPAGMDVSVYRIVEEGLTNALKHAPGSRVHVRLAREPGAVAVEVENDRPGGERRTAVASGQGLTGLRERVAVYGGSLDAGPTDGGGFRVAARMPLGEPE